MRQPSAHRFSFIYNQSISVGNQWHRQSINSFNLHLLTKQVCTQENCAYKHIIKAARRKHAEIKGYKRNSEGLTHWGRATNICVGKLTTIGSDNGLSHGQRQAIIWTIAGILLIEPLGTNFSEIFIGIQTFSFKKMHLKISSAKLRPFVLASMS